MAKERILVDVSSSTPISPASSEVAKASDVAQNCQESKEMVPADTLVENPGPGPGTQTISPHKLQFPTETSPQPMVEVAMGEALHDTSSTKKQKKTKTEKKK